MIAIPGGTGKIGKEAVKALQILEPGADFIIGSRHRTEEALNWRFLDGNDPMSLSSFLDGASLVLNVAGPSALVSPPILEAARKRGIPLVDVGDGGCYRTFEEGNGRMGADFEDCTVLYGCGSVPGLIGLLPLILAEEFGYITDITVNYRIDEEISLSAARDMAFNMRAASSDGSFGAALTKPENIPLLGEEVYRYPYYDKECELVEHILSPKKSTWYMIRPDTEYEKLLSGSYEDREELAEKISRMSRFSCGEQKSGIRFIVEMHGVLKSVRELGVRTLYAVCGAPSEVSGKVVASVASALYRNRNIKGCFRPASFPERGEILENLKRLSLFESWRVYPYPLTVDAEEEGEL